MKIERERERRTLWNECYIYPYKERLDSKEQKITIKLNNYSFYYINKLIIFCLISE